MNKITRFLHLRGLHVLINTFLVNKIYAGSKPKYFEKKRKLLNSIGHDIGMGTKIVAPIEWNTKISIGKNCWIGKNFIVNGNGNLTIEDNCDIAPEVTILTGGHKIGTIERRAGEGQSYHVIIHSGTWVGARSTLYGDIEVGPSCVIGACAFVCRDVPENTLVGGVPAKLIKYLKP